MTCIFPKLNTVLIPKGVGGALVGKRLLDEYNVEIGAGLDINVPSC